MHLDQDGHLLLGDFGAASYMNCLTTEQIQAMLRIEKRALAHFIEDLWQQTDVDNAYAEQLQTWHQQLLNDEIELAELLLQMDEIKSNGV